MIAFVALGSNLGNRSNNLAMGIRHLAGLGKVTVSPVVMETEDESGTGPAYLNTVAKLDTAIPDPMALLEECLRIELECGRDRALPPNAPRPLDLDLITAAGWGGEWHWEAPADLVCVAPRITLIMPHPRAKLREFVMVPLAALGADIGQKPSCAPHAQPQ